MNIVFGTNVDLVYPFPVAETSRVWGWMQCYRSMVLHDDSLLEPEAYNAHAAALAEAGLAYAIVDKNNMVGMPEVAAPLVGIVAFEPGAAGNVYIHIATSRRCGRSYKLYGVSLVDEAVELACADMFERFPGVRRVSAIVLDTNTLVAGLAKRVGFALEGRLRAWFSKDGQPHDALHFGKVRPSAAEVDDVICEEPA